MAPNPEPDIERCRASRSLDFSIIKHPDKAAAAVIMTEALSQLCMSDLMETPKSGDRRVRSHVREFDRISGLGEGGQESSHRVRVTVETGERQ